MLILLLSFLSISRCQSQGAHSFFETLAKMNLPRPQVSNLVEYQELMKNISSRPGAKKVQRTSPLLSASQSGQYNYIIAMSYISTTSDSCAADQYPVQWSGNPLPLNVCDNNVGIICSCVPGEDHSYKLDCDYYSNSACTGSPFFSDTSTVTPSCQEYDFYGTYGGECVITDRTDTWNINPSTVFSYQDTCSSSMNYYGSTFSDICLTEVFCFSGSKSCIMSCNGNTLTVTSYDTGDCTGTATKGDYSSALSCTCLEGLTCVNTFCST